MKASAGTDVSVKLTVKNDSDEVTEGLISAGSARASKQLALSLCRTSKPFTDTFASAKGLLSPIAPSIKFSNYKFELRMNHRSRQAFRGPGCSTSSLFHRSPPRCLNLTCIDSEVRNPPILTTYARDVLVQDGKIRPSKYTQLSSDLVYYLTTPVDSGGVSLLSLRDGFWADNRTWVLQRSTPLVAGLHAVNDHGSHRLIAPSSGMTLQMYKSHFVSLRSLAVRYDSTHDEALNMAQPAARVSKITPTTPTERHASYISRSPLSCKHASLSKAERLRVYCRARSHSRGWRPATVCPHLEVCQSRVEQEEGLCRDAVSASRVHESARSR